MKIVNINKTIGNQQLADFINEKLNPLFKKQRQIDDLSFTAEIKDDAVEIYASKIYEGFLYRIEILGSDLNITRSEHYIDDVNSITVESILNSLFEDVSGEEGVSLTLEG